MERVHGVLAGQLGWEEAGRGQRRDCPLMSSMMWSGDPSELGASAAVVQGEMLELLMCSSVAGRERVEVQSIARLCEVCQAEMRERFRGHRTKISDRFFFSCSDKLPIFSLSGVSQ